jgi:uncharacterized Fe-S center protein
MTGNEIQVTMMPSPSGLSAQDLVAMGEDLRALGIQESRAVVAELQELAMKSAVAASDVFMSRLRRVVVARDAQLIRAVAALTPLQLPRILIGNVVYVSRDSVLALIQATSNLGATQ